MQNVDIKAVILCIQSAFSSLLGTGCFGKVCKESNCALQGWPGSAEPDGLHSKRGALIGHFHWEVFKLITDSLLDASETKARNRSLFCLFFCLSEGFHRRLHATYSSCSLWVTSCETALPSAHAGTFMSLGFPTGEALTGRMPSTDQHYVSKYTPDFTFHSSFFFFPPVQVLWMEQLHWLVLEPLL